MPCYAPLYGFKSRHVNPSGKRSIVFNRSEGFADLPVTVPCGSCVGCVSERARQWAVRCMHEASLHDENCFLTLTYDDKHIPANGQLDKKAFPKFIRRIRKAYHGKRIRYFMAGEYGSRTLRPHYHCILFGFDFNDKVYFTTRKGHRCYISAELARFWPFGLCEIGDVTFESAAYVARYCVKKRRHYSNVEEVAGPIGEGVTGFGADDIGFVEEYAQMSRRPGIGAEWIDRFGDEVFRADSVIVNGVECKPPRYYECRYEKVNEERVRAIKRKRDRDRDVEESTPERLQAREKVALAKLKLKERGL